MKHLSMWGVVALAVVIFGGLFAFNRLTADDLTPTETAEQWYAAVMSGDGEKACELMNLTDDTRDACEESIGALGTLAKNAGAPENASATLVSEDGSTATVSIGFGGDTEQMALTKVDGEWKISGGPIG